MECRGACDMSDVRFKPRAVMDIAIEAMLESVDELRDDGKASPKVGAVLVKPGAAQPDTAHHGELRDGDHAEFTLLERKNPDRKLDDCVLFTTLEPYAPGARRHPKLSCAERIVLARIKEVWVGIEDPDPTVDRKGIKYLQDKGVVVHMFDRDLQEVIREANKDFIAQALERAATEEERHAKTITLSRLEHAFGDAVIEDFSEEALEQYRNIAMLAEKIGSPAFNRRLVQQGLLEHENRKLTPTGFGLLLFGKEPRTAMPQAGLLGTVHYPDGREEPKDFDGPQLFAPADALQWLRDKMPNPIDRSEARRGELHEPLFELAREGIVNAIVHRDYGIDGAKCQLIATADTITVKSPGGPVEPITLDQMQSFNAPVLSRNPVLHYVFARMEMAEERGLGLKSMRNCAEQAELPLPKYSWEDPYLVLTLYSDSASVTRTLPPHVLAARNDDERTSWEFIAAKGTVTTSELRAQAGFDEKKAQRVLKQLMEVQLIRRVGKARATRYEVM